jgi:hypothetical protein
MDVYSQEIPDSVREMVEADERRILGDLFAGSAGVAPKLRPDRKLQ